MVKKLTEFKSSTWIKSASNHAAAQGKAESDREYQAAVKHLKLKNRAVSHLYHSVANSVKKEDVEVLETSDLPDFVCEKEDHSNTMDPPAVLIMRRKTVRTFSNGQRVAMYYIDKINKYVTVPYLGLQWGSPSTEEVESVGDMIEEDLIHHLNDVVANGYRSIKHHDGTSTRVDATTANMMLKVHSALSDENKKKFADYSHKSKHHFSKMVDFGWKQVK